MNNLSNDGKQVFKQVSQYIRNGDTEKRRADRVTALAEESKNFRLLVKETGKFSVILADPPWRYDHTVSENRANRESL